MIRLLSMEAARRTVRQQIFQLMTALHLVKVGQDHLEVSPPNSHSTWRHAPHGVVGWSVSATTAMRVNERCPSESALKMATRSAHIVRP